MKLASKLSMLALAVAIAAGGSASASGMMASKSKMPVCKGPTVYAVSMRKVYYVRGETMYGHAKGGTYMCMAAANGKGFKKL